MTKVHNLTSTVDSLWKFLLPNTLILLCLVILALDRCSEFDEPGSNELLSGLHTVTNEYWLKRIKLSDTDEILEIMHPLKPWACKYLTKLDNIEKEVIDSMFVKKKNNSITH